MAFPEPPTIATDWVMLDSDSEKPLSAKNGIHDGEIDSVSSASESSGAETMTVNNGQGGDRGTTWKENQKILWTETRRILRGLLAQYAMAKGMQDHAAMVARLAPTATLGRPRGRGSVGDISTRVFALQQTIMAGIVGKEQETELGMLISLAIFSRNKDHTTESVKERQKMALSTREIADLAPLAVTPKLFSVVRLSEEGAIAAQQQWLLSELGKGLKVLADAQSTSTGLSLVSKLRLEK